MNNDLLFVACITVFGNFIILSFVIFNSLKIKKSVKSRFSAAVFNIFILISSLVTAFAVILLINNTFMPKIELNPLAYIWVYIILTVLLIIMYKFGKNIIDILIKKTKRFGSKISFSQRLKSIRKPKIDEINMIISQKLSYQNHYFTGRLNDIQFTTRNIVQENNNLKLRIITMEEEMKELNAKCYYFKEEINKLNEKYDKIMKEMEPQKKSYENKIALSKISLQETDNMNGEDFELFCQKILIANGFINVYTTKTTGDYGVDLLAEKDSVTYAIQCKCYSSSVGNKAVQEAFSGKSYYNCMVACVMTNNFFT